MKGRASGFTLIELVLSSALMAMILASAYLCLRAGVTSRKLVEEREEVLQNGRVALALLSADLRSACPLSKDIEFLGMHRSFGETNADNLDFATHNYTPRRRGEGDWCEVSYFLDQDPESGTFSLWRRRDPTPDEEPLAGGSREEIARGVHGLSFEYYDGYDWYEEWGDINGKAKVQSSLRDRPNLTGLPEAVRVTLALDAHPPSATATARRPGTAEPPVIFQTVARLNLAALPTSSSASGSATNSSGSNPESPGAQPPPPGGGPG